ncbi:hypothetical protein S144_53 [Shewanella sp. phage 1/44]|uniref:hypothetical protein n=1 Tax=Shewanella sp. phage 1/44 TaxID=1458862 RepID=UPI0004F85466|nr:hypothetical protein S144_53 [Shewanella sp. phage 1/44]AHK11767.1 hypothetical protein S144_53 [Shewanella sp. phage 1/44]
MTNKTNMGKTGRDIITGFTGIITGVASYITGCDQYSLAGKAKDDNVGTTMWVDVNRVEINDGAECIKINTTVDQGACESPSKA